MRYKIWCYRTNRDVENDTDILNRKGYNNGEYAIRPDGTVCFYESTDGGMDVRMIDMSSVEVILLE